MKATALEKEILGNNVIVVKRNKNCTIYKLEDSTGEGYMTYYPVFKGIDLIYNDFHMESCFSDIKPRGNIIEINHCREGRIECGLENGTYMYLKPGELCINSRKNRAISSSFPLCHYHGISVSIDILQLSSNTSSIMNEISIDIKELFSKFCTGNGCLVMRAKESIEHIFSELYTIPDEVKSGYFKVKVLELLMFLSITNISEESEKREYFSSHNVNTVKNIMEYITKHSDKHFTLNELSSRFNIPLTTMKLCFKGVYGSSIYSYLRSYRMEKAALLLTSTNESVITIANKVGYSNSSKFAAAFRDVMKTTPMEHRKINV